MYKSRASSSRQRVLVLFPDDWASFSPTLTRLVDLLGEKFEVEAHVLDTGRFDLGKLDSGIYRRIVVHTRLARVLRKLGMLRIVRTVLLAWRASAAARHATHTIAIDADGAAACWLTGQRMHYVSLEVERPSLAQWIVPRHALSVVIQSRERLDYQFHPGSIDRLPVFFVQNAPSMVEVEALAPATRDLSHPRMVYMGNMRVEHGLSCMLDLLRAWPEASLTLRGFFPNACLAKIQRDYRDLFADGRLSLTDDYLEEADIPPFLSGFDLGLCLYEPPRRGKLDFNYRSAPAGKMFNYFAAGLPVLASDLPGLRPVADFGAGIQARSNQVGDLLVAGQALCANHAQYREGALRAARHFDFSAAGGAFVKFLDSGTTRQ